MEPRLPLWRRPQHAAAARGPRPFVEVPDVPIHAQRRNVEGDRGGRVRAVGQDRDPPNLQRGGDLGQRKHNRRVGGDMVHDRQARVRSHGRRPRLRQALRGKGRGYRDRAHDRALSRAAWMAARVMSP